MEECDGLIKDVFVSYFKECNQQVIDTLYKKYGPYNPRTSIACCYLKCIVAVSCWNEEAIREAYKYVKETHNMLIRLQVEHQIFGTPTEKLSLKVLTAESLLLLAVMKMAIKRCIKHYFKAGMNLRKSWKMFSASQMKICELCENAGINSTKLDELIREGSLPDTLELQEDTTTETTETEDTFVQSFDLVEDFRSFFDNKETCVPAVKELKDLKVMSLFGYGLFHLILSLIPPSVLRVVNLLGFHGNRYLGLTSLNTVASAPDEYRSILASIALLWYQLSLRPTFISNPQHLNTGIEQAYQIIEDKLGTEFQDTWLTLYFTATIRKLQGDVEGALQMFQTTAIKSAHLRECKLMAYYEIGWCQLIVWNWSQASEIFSDLMAEARWSKGFYGYLAAISMGASGGSVAGCRALLSELPRRIKKTVNVELDTFCSAKSEKLAISQNLEYECKLATLEMLYVWKCLTLTESQSKEIIQTVNNRPLDLNPSSLATSYLLVGISWRALKDLTKAEQALNISDTIAKDDEKDNYITVCVLTELAELYLQLGQTERGKQAAERARNDYRGYHLENRLYNRIHILNISNSSA